MNLAFCIENHQTVVEIPPDWLQALEQAAPLAAAEALRVACSADAPLALLDSVDVALVDDPTSDRVHREFMDIPGCTDVITFHHGEIVIGVEVAFRQAREFGEPPGRELLRYLVHGLRHLAGQEDDTPEARAIMEAAQEDIILQLAQEETHGCLLRQQP
jgi:probable rRNA maturation factor